MKLTDNLTPNFKAGEFFVTNADGGQAGLWRDFQNLSEADKGVIWNNLKLLATRLETVRTMFNAPVSISSGWRSGRVNVAVGGASRSTHRTGKAADINIRGFSPKEVQRRLSPIWKGGLGFGDTFTHLDTSTNRRWNY